ncbi:MAG: alpha/beta hydrolase [Gammaproteobacteria bacterium]|nr:alpha/beta hydrolase [Gammaproteobacteria bacterium]
MRRQHSVAGGDGLRLNVMEWGRADGRPILFVHGWSQTHLCWMKQVESALAEEFRLVAFDLRGHGLSEAPAGQKHYTGSAAWADDVKAVIEALALRDVVLVGWSYAGLVITDYLRAYGDAGIGAVNFVGAAVRIGEQAMGPLIGPGFTDVFAHAAGHDLEAAIDAMRVFIERCFAVKLSRRDYERVLCWNMTVRPDVRAALGAREVDNCDVLGELTCPVLVSHGRRDVTVLPAMAELILEHCPQAAPSWYDDVAHGPFMEDPLRFNAELGEFARRARG